MHAVVVHEGTPDMGHYYIFIKDHNSNLWRKFNDTRVTIVAEHEVFESSFGGLGGRTAFWVIYIDKE